MGLFDSIKKSVLNEAKSAVNHAASDAVRKAQHEIRSGVQEQVKQVASAAQVKQVTFTFSQLPTSADALKSMPEAALDTVYKTGALTMATLCHFKTDPEQTFAMLDVLKGPEPLSPAEKQFIRERLADKPYLPESFFKGATTANGYHASEPFTITVSTNPYSFPEENWATVYVSSAGADSPRSIRLRKKLSTGQWFLNEIQCLSGIRLPAEEDPWA